MIYLIFACFCVFFVFSFVQIRRVKTHDQVLFPFCQLRRDIMSFLYESVFEKPGTLSQEEYTAVRRLSDALDDTIHNYNEHKTLMFNLREIMRYLKRYRDTLNQAAPINITDNAEIQEFHARFVRCLAKAFVAYTPLIRWELALKVIALVYHAGHRATSKHMREYVLVVAEQVRAAARGDGVGGLAT